VLLRSSSSTNLLLDSIESPQKLLPIEWSGGLDTLFPRLQAAPTEAPFFGCLSLGEPKGLSSCFDTFGETLFSAHGCRGFGVHSLYAVPALCCDFFVQEVYSAAYNMEALYLPAPRPQNNHHDQQGKLTGASAKERKPLWRGRALDAESKAAPATDRRALKRRDA
jgi:hypothetical protein